jgi:hypothetical protein
MGKGLKKLQFVLKLSAYPISPLLRKIGVRYDIVKILNNYYQNDFKSTPVKERAVMLPHCLIHKKCPAKFSKEDGILCINCGLCRCGEIKKLCEEKGYQFYITPSFGFTKRLAERKHLRALIGTTCSYEIKKGMKNEKLGSKGMDVKNHKLIPQIMPTSKYDCINNDLDWNLLKKMIKES